MSRVLVCTQFDVPTNTCVASEYQEFVVPAVLPPLPLDEAALISAGILACWGIGFLIKQARRIPESSQ